MPTVRTYDALLAMLADNTSADITEGTLRDFLATFNALIRATLSGMDYADRSASRLGLPGQEEIQFEVGSNGPRMALSDSEQELWFFNTGITFAKGVFADPINTLKDSGYIDHSSEHDLYQAQVATEGSPQHGVGFTTYRVTRWDAGEGASVNEDIDVYADNWDEGYPLYYYIRFKGDHQIVFDEFRRIWPDADATGALGRTTQRWADLFLAPPSDPAGLDVGQVWADQSGGANVLRLSDGGASPGDLAAIFTVRYDLTPDEIATMFSSPVTMLAAPGAGKAIVPISVAFQWKPGTHPFYTSQPIGLDEGGGFAIPPQFTVSFASLTPSIQSAAVTLNDSIVENAALRLTAENDPGLAGGVTASTLVDGGDSWLPGDTGYLDGGDGGATFTVLTTLNAFPITAVNQGAKTITVTGDATATLPAAATAGLFRSTGNDGAYTVVSSVFGAGSTVITVVEAIPDATADGSIGDGGAVPYPGAIGTYTLDAPGDGYAVDALTGYPQPSFNQGPGDFTVDAIDPTSDGTARIEVTYRVMDLLV